MTLLRSTLQASAGRPLLPALALLAVTMLGGCAGATGSDASRVPTTTVDLPKSYRFAPAAITVTAGGTVTWTNHDDFTHSVRLAGDGGVQVMAPGQSVSYTFAAPGLYQYDCSLHPRDMKGSVLVTGS